MQKATNEIAPTAYDRRAPLSFERDQDSAEGYSQAERRR
jgi:hypothetical protein